MKFEKLELWQRSYQLCRQVYLEMKTCRDFGLKDQITRSALSVPSNIAEGDERDTDQDCARFFYYAKGSCGELLTQLMLAKDIGYINHSKADELMKESRIISKMLASLIKWRKGTVK